MYSLSAVPPAHCVERPTMRISISGILRGCKGLMRLFSWDNSVSLGFNCVGVTMAILCLAGVALPTLCPGRVSRFLSRCCSGRWLPLLSHSAVESVNFHFNRTCNYACSFCFHTNIDGTLLSLEVGFEPSAFLQPPFLLPPCGFLSEAKARAEETCSCRHEEN